MRKILFTTLTMLILSLSASSLSAQGMMGGGYGDMGMGMHKPFQHLEMLQYMLDLTNAQVDKVYKIDKDYMDRFYQNRNNADKIKDLREKHLGEIESILTPEQKIKWNDFKENHPMMKDGKHGKGMQNNDRECFAQRGEIPGDNSCMFQKDLGLSNEQLDKIHKIHKDNMDNFYQNRNDGDKVRELQKKQDAEIDSVLTADQKAKLDEMKKHHPMRDKKQDDGKGHHDMKKMHDGKGHHGMNEAEEE